MPLSGQTTLSGPLDQLISHRAAKVFDQSAQTSWMQTDRVLALLMAVQWVAGVGIALWISPRAWDGIDDYIHPHVWMAVLVGGLIATAPIVLAIWCPGQTITRMVIATAQMLHSSMLIHLSGGRIETHFHVFGSLAFLSFYRDWRVLIPATATVAIDHALRGLYWPQSAFGVVSASHWRWLEHAGWVIFEDIVLVWSCVRGYREWTILARRQAELEATNERVEAEVSRQTAQLDAINHELIGTARRAGMAEIATGVLHNVGNVLNSVNVAATVAVQTLRNSELTSLAKAGQMLKANQENLCTFLTSDERGKHLPPFIIEVVECLGAEQEKMLGELQTLQQGLEHIKQIVSAQQQHAKHGTLREKVTPSELFEQALAMDPALAAADDIQIVRQFEPIPAAAIDKHRVLQILLNLISNAKKAVRATGRPDGRIVLRTSLIDSENGNRIHFEVCDNGEGIDSQNLMRIFSHGFTTNKEGHGFGLHSSANAAKEMNGELRVQSAGRGHGATFTLDVPLIPLTAAEEQVLSKRK